MGMTIDELRNYVEEQRSLNNIPYHVYSTLIDGIDTLEQEPTTKNDLGVDCISRQAVLNAIDTKAWEFCDYLISKGRNDEQKPVSHFADNLRECVREELPSVTPQEPKTGHWTYRRNEKGNWENICSNCGLDSGVGYPYPYCPSCGAKMESEDKECK